MTIKTYIASLFVSLLCHLQFRYFIYSLRFDFWYYLYQITSQWKVFIISLIFFTAKVYLDNVKLETAVFQGSGEPADWVEVCEKKGYIPGSLNTCKDGYTRDPPNGNEFDNCVPCNCHGHGDTCNPNTGE